MDQTWAWYDNVKANKYLKQVSSDEQMCIFSEFELGVCGVFLVLGLGFLFCFVLNMKNNMRIQFS